MKRLPILPILLPLLVALPGMARAAPAAQPQRASGARSLGSGPCGWSPSRRERWPFRGLSRYRGGNRVRFMPGYGLFPTWGIPALWTGGYGYGGFSPFALGAYGYPYPSFGGGFVGPESALPTSIVQRVVVVREPAPSAEGDREAATPRWTSGDEGRFYLDAGVLPAAPRSAIDVLTSQIRVRHGVPENYTIEWTGDPAEVAWLDVQVIDTARQVLSTRSLQEAPFSGALNLPAEAAAVILSVEYRSGKSISVKLPVGELRTLAGQ